MFFFLIEDPDIKLPGKQEKVNGRFLLHHRRCCCAVSPGSPSPRTSWTLWFLDTCTANGHVVAFPVPELEPGNPSAGGPGEVPSILGG